MKTPQEMSIPELCDSISAGLDKLLELERAYAALYHLPLPECSGVNTSTGCSVPADVPGKPQGRYGHETLSALRRVSALDARLDPTPEELSDMLQHINQQE